MSSPQTQASTAKIAIVCDWLTGYGGAERVVLELHKMYPKAPIYTSQYDPSKIDWFINADVRTGWLQRLPKSLKKFLPVLRAWYFSRLDLSDYDLVISSSGAEAKGIKTGKNTTHICYCHSPTHYYWIRYQEYLETPGFPKGFNWLARLGLRTLLGPMRRWDKHAARRPNFLVANSTYTQNNIKKYYKRGSEIVFPPVDTERFKATRKQKARRGIVVAGRQTPYKRIDLAIKACNDLRTPLTVIGNGPDHENLQKLASRNVTFLTKVNDQEIVNYFQTALLFIMPNMDDFGIVPVEAMSAGTPVIAYKKGGSLDYMIEGETGEFFEKQTSADLQKAVESSLAKKYNYDTISEHAEKFSVGSFRQNMQEVIDKFFTNK